MKGDGMRPLAIVVDDEPLIRMDTADIVADAGYDVIEADSASQAIAYIAGHSAVCLVVTDIQMPEIDGITFARHVAAHWPEIAVVVASGAVTPGHGELPADASFVLKPFSPRRMVEAIQHVRSLH